VGEAIPRYSGYLACVVRGDPQKPFIEGLSKLVLHFTGSITAIINFKGLISIPRIWER